MSVLESLMARKLDGVSKHFSDPQLIYSGFSAINPTCPSGQGNVYHYNESGGTRQNVAIKKYLIIEGSKDEKLVESEIITMAKCGQHQNILRLHSIYIYHGCVFLVTPYCNGGTLQQYCIDNWVTLSQMVSILKGLLSGLVEIHKHGYIHRDIKCENFFLGEDNTIVIGGFGFSSLKPIVKPSSEEAGDILFWAPEVCEGKFINQKADIWALGIVVLKILNFGKAPYEDDHLEKGKLKRKIIEQGRPHYPRNMNDLLMDFVDRCLKPDYSQRASASELLEEQFNT
ncbi:kinase-like domain-containing protein [Jimgerdemannia flammicorona]|uniref:Kinase-like domain-containing protein n=1 Tax=Jimgerdemannia flammicorona TaxID=994334 RepID=A0A433DP41_9FUNG|nr:kinase-like domain-containing protein [Jimgerdemannia flammicorona]